MLTDGLARGYTLRRNGSDLSGEGMGFGVPVVVTGWRTYLSFGSDDRVTPEGHTVRTFHMDAIQCVRKPGNRRESILDYLWLETKGTVYKAAPPVQSFLAASRRVTGMLGAEIGFDPTDSLGEVEVEYAKTGGCLDIKLDLAKIRRLPGKKRVYILNEQDALEFPLYIDSDGARLERRRVGGWERVKAESACFTSGDGEVRFAVGQRPGAVLYRGRETLDGQLSWAGLIYDVTAMTEDVFEYRVEL